MNSLASIEEFLETRELAIAGVSRDPKKFGRQVYEHLKKNGFRCYPVNPAVDSINGEKCYRSISELPAGVDRIYIVTPSSGTAGSIRETLEKGIRRIWVQQRSESDEAMKLLENEDVNLIYKRCILMFAEPVGGAHTFHRLLSRLFGNYPK